MPKRPASGNKSVVFYLQIVGVLLLISLPFVFSPIYQKAIAPNPNATFGGGFIGGRYDEFLKSFVKELKQNSQLNKSTSILTGGSYENIKKLEQGEIDFALFQAGSDESVDLEIVHDEIAFVTNVFPEVAHLIVRNGLTDDQVRNFEFKRVALGAPTSGDYRVGLAVIEHLNLDLNSIDKISVDYKDVITGFREDKIDLAVLSVGTGAKVIRELVTTGDCRLIDFPMRDAFLAKHVAYSSYTIPTGTYFFSGSSLTKKDIESVAVNAQLITRKDMPSNSVLEVLKTLNRSTFLRENRLVDLFRNEQRYATGQPEFEIHPGTSRYYDPSFRPWLNPDFVEATEGIRSFVFSGLIGLFLLFRWLRIRSERSQAHKLDEYIHRLLAIEQEQMELDQDYTDEQILRLEGYLDEVTVLRREALEEFTAHELNDDPAIECFISMSHALSQKVNAKLTRDAIRKLAKTGEQSENRVED